MTKLAVPTSLALRPAQWLVLGRGVGFVATFAVPLVLARLFDQATFGVYKQLFVIYGTLYGVAQLGVAESLYHFIPRHPASVGRYALNAVITLAVVGCAAALLLDAGSGVVARWLTSPPLADLLRPLGLFLALMLASAMFEIVLVSRATYQAAASIYAASDLARAACLLLAAAVFGGLRAVLWGAIAFATLRLVAMLWFFSRTLRVELRPSSALWRTQWAYTLPFALAVGLEVLQANVHFYAVAAQFTPAAFAVYAVGCLQIPLVDIVTTSSGNVMMVKMAEPGFDSRGPAALALWHETTRRLALVILPLVVFLVAMARDIIIVLFTSTYLDSVPIFALWTCTLVFSIACVDSVLRVHAQTRFLFWLNVIRLGTVIALISWSLAVFGLAGAALTMLVSTALVRTIGLARIATVLNVRFSAVLPWTQLATIAAWALVAAAPTVWFAHVSALPRLPVLIGAAGIYATTYALLSYTLGNNSDIRLHVRHRWNHQMGR